MKKRIISCSLIIIILTIAVIPPRVAKATTVPVAIEVGGEVATFFIMLAAAFNLCEETSVDINDIYTMSDKDAKVRDVVIDGKTYKVENGDIYRMSDTLMQYVAKEYTPQEIQALNDNIKIEDGKMTFGKLSTQTMTEKFRNVATSLVKDRCMFGDITENDAKIYKNMSTTQIQALTEVLVKGNQANWTNAMKEVFKKKPFYCIYATTKEGYMRITDGVGIAFSATPFALRPYGGDGNRLQLTDTKGNAVEYFHLMGNGSSNEVLTDIRYQSAIKSGYGSTMVDNVMVKNDVTFITNGMAVTPLNTWFSLENGKYTSVQWGDMVDSLAQTYVYPYAIDSMKAVTFNKAYATDTVAYNYDTIDLKDVGTDLDTVVGKINGLVEQDKQAGLSTLHDQSALRELVNTTLINTTKDDDKDNPTVTNEYINQQIDRIIEKMNEQIATVKGIDTLTKEDLQSVLEGLQDGTLTKEELRDLINEQEKEAENENVETLEKTDLMIDKGITTKFPFCIPFDLIRIITRLKTPNKLEPKFEIPFKFDRLGIDEKIVLDFTQFEPLVKVIRWFVLFSFIVSLILITRKVIKG